MTTMTMAVMVRILKPLDGDWKTHGQRLRELSWIAHCGQVAMGARSVSGCELKRRDRTEAAKCVRAMGEERYE